MRFLPLCLAAYAVLATQRRLQDDEEATTDETEEEDEGLPTGISINGFNRKMDIMVIPSWDLFLGFSDARKVIEGRFTVISVYQEAAQTFVGSPHAVIDVENFGDGTKRDMGTLAINEPVLGNGQSASTVYIGEFSQAASPNFDMSCFPFDEKEAVFRIALQRPTEMVFKLTLHCEGAESNQTVDGKVRRTCTSAESKGSYVGFDWGQFMCEEVDDDFIRCKMNGIRQTASVFNSYMWPSLIFTLMGFLAFALDVKMAMPRVGTTMLALVSLTNLRNSVVATLPTSGSISWLEEYFLVSKTFMFLNLAGHALSFYLDAIGKKKLQKLINRFNIWGMLLIMYLIVAGRLLVRDCDPFLVDRTFLTLLVVLMSLALIAFTAYLLVSFRMTKQILPIIPAPPKIFIDKGHEEE